MLSGHSVLGLTAAFLMYVICLSGTFDVFFKEFWRWEQPTIAESMEVSGERIEQAVRNAMAEHNEPLPFIGLDMPTSDWPRMVISYDGQRRHVAQDGALIEPVDRSWAFFMARLHFALNLPLQLGIVIVGIFGVVLTALIISGFLAHPGILRDAFSFRMNRSRQLQQTDLHNRLSVWGAPFHFIIAVTGAILGLSGMVTLAASLFSTPAPDSASVIPETPATVIQRDEQQTAVPLPDFASIWADFTERAPDDQVFYLSLYDIATPEQRVIVNAIRPDRLYWSNNHLYSTEGQYLETTNGDNASLAGKVQSSLFRLHFGHFGGIPVKIMFLLLGTALCVITASGVNIWLAKRRQRKLPAEAIDRVWQVAVWGTLGLIPLSAVLYLILNVPPVPVFWIGLAVLAIVAWRAGTAAIWSSRLRAAAWALSLTVPIIHTLYYGQASWMGGSLIINLLWVSIAAGVALFQFNAALPGARQVARP